MENLQKHGMIVSFGYASNAKRYFGGYIYIYFRRLLSATQSNMHLPIKEDDEFSETASEVTSSLQDLLIEMQRLNRSVLATTQQNAQPRSPR
ncbi:hypothetical protein PHMEG_0007660 [Phytophthora megakarya]|uniref:Uncharacterized protein n=1 Tax=Phytophthora megakarya TaxID=4795 RepID=A0A225WKM2_9STRA|nr:hypothetical protein PHMEG_0007660 [Phytophthora megakarya]